MRKKIWIYIRALCGITVLAAPLILGGITVAAFFAKDDVTITVKDKERIVNRNGKGARYLVWSEEGEVFEDVDSFLGWKFNSSDIYGQLDEGTTYNCKVYGWRIPFLSKYRNIVSCSEKSE